MRAVYREKSPSISCSKRPPLLQSSKRGQSSTRLPLGFPTNGCQCPLTLPSVHVQSSCERHSCRGAGGQAELCVFSPPCTHSVSGVATLCVAVGSSRVLLPSSAVCGSERARVEVGGLRCLSLWPSDLSCYCSHWDHDSVQGWSVHSLWEKGTNGTEEPVWGQAAALVGPCAMWGLSVQL